MSTDRAVPVAVVGGVVHAAVLLAVALHLGYAVGPTEYSIAGALWRYGGLVVLAALPVWLAIRFRLATPLLALLVTTGYVLGMELTPPGPTFRDVAELEGLAEPTGITVVENGLYVVRYMVNATVWTVGFLLLGLVEHAVRASWRRLPAVPIPGLSIPASGRRATGVAAAGGLLHAAVMTWFAYRLGVTATGVPEWLSYLFGALGTWILAAIPLYLLLRQGLIAPVALLAAFVLLDARAEFTASVDDPHALYFGAWFFFLAILLVVAAVEYGLRRLDVRRRLSALG